MLALLLAAAVAVEPFDPVEFFRGRTRGEGTLRPVLQKSKIIRVDSIGSEQKDGAMLLTQTIHEPGKPPRTRTWRMRRDSPGRYSGSLSDAKGPVRVTVEPGAIRIRYKDKDNLDFDQRLTPAGSREIRNRMTIKRFGITVARYDEIIRKLD
jgi:hypothetical protein